MLLPKQAHKLIQEVVAVFIKSKNVQHIDSQITNECISFKYTTSAGSEKQLFQYQTYFGFCVPPQTPALTLRCQIPNAKPHILGNLVSQANKGLQTSECIFYFDKTRSWIIGKLGLLESDYSQNYCMWKEHFCRILDKVQNQLIEIFKKYRQKQLKHHQNPPQQPPNSKNYMKKLKKLYNKINVCRDKINLTTSNSVGSSSYTIINPLINPAINQKLSTNPHDDEYKQISKYVYQLHSKHKQPTKTNKSPNEKDELSINNHILTPVYIVEEQFDECWKPSSPNSFGNIARMNAKFHILKSSVFNQTNQKLDKTKEAFQSQPPVSDFLIKKISKNGEDAYDSFMTEIWMLVYMRSMDCAFIGQYYLEEISNHISEAQSIYAKYYPQTLEQFISQRNSPKYFFYIIESILRGLKFLKGLQVSHRDLKMQNIMMEKLTPKIIDFGSSITFKQKEFAPFLSGKLRSTHGYYVSPNQIRNEMMIEQIINSDKSIKKPFKEMSPEQRQSNLYEIVTRHPNFDIFSLGKIIEIYLRQVDRKNINNSFIAQKLDWVLSICKSQNPLARPNIQQIVNIWTLMRVCWETTEFGN